MEKQRKRVESSEFRVQSISANLKATYEMLCHPVSPKAREGSARTPQPVVVAREPFELTSQVWTRGPQPATRGSLPQPAPHFSYLPTFGVYKALKVRAHSCVSPQNEFAYGKNYPDYRQLTEYVPARRKGDSNQRFAVLNRLAHKRMSPLSGAPINNLNDLINDALTTPISRLTDDGGTNNNEKFSR